MSDQNRIQHDMIMQDLVTRTEFSIVGALKPRIFPDGSQWCVLYGENLQEGVAGFGKSPILAVYDFNKAWHRELKP